MISSLKPEGALLVLGDVLLRTPGLTGTVEVRRPTGAGLRAASDLPVAFVDAIASNAVHEQLTVEIRGHKVWPALAAGRSPAGEDIELRAPAPGDHYWQLLLYVAEDGTVSWHAPEQSHNVPQTYGDSHFTYRVPRTIWAPAVDSDGSPSRGLLGAIGKKLLKVLIFPLIKPLSEIAGNRFAAWWEDGHRANRLRIFDPDGYRELQPSGPFDVRRLGSGPALLFVHGTASQAHSAFGSMPVELMNELYTRYEHRVFAFDHYTLSVSPDANVAWLANELRAAPPLTVDIIAHSRGGLVSRAIVEKGTELGIADRLRVRNVIMVATPNAGTVLVQEKYLGKLLDRLTNLVLLIPGGPVTDVIGDVLAVMKQVALGMLTGLDGLTAMDPDKEYLRDLNKQRSPQAIYRAIASDFEPGPHSPLMRMARDQLTDALFNAANDLVVPTDGVSAIAGQSWFKPADPLRFPREAGIDHSGYWQHPDFGAHILRWLSWPGSGPPGSQQDR